MQSLPTLTVCTLYAGIIHFVLFHNSVRIDGSPQLTRARVVDIVTVTYHHFNITFCFLAYLSCLLLVASTIGLTVESNWANRFESIFLHESNLIETILVNRNAVLCSGVRTRREIFRHRFHTPLIYGREPSYNADL